MEVDYIRLGIDVRTGEPVYVSEPDWLMHTAVFGVTGTGKSTLLEQVARQIILAHDRRRQGLCVIDRPGTMLRSLVDWQAACDLAIPNVLMDLSDCDHIVAYTPIRKRAGKSNESIVREAVLSLAHVRGEHSLDRTARLELVATNLLHALMLAGATFAEADALLDPMDNALRDAIVDRLDDERVKRWWKQAQSMPPRQRATELASTRNRLARLTTAPTLRRMLGQNSSIDLDRLVARGDVLLSSVGTRPTCADGDADTLFSLLLSDLWNVARERSPGSAPFTVMLDEFHALITPAVIEGLPQSRKFGVAFVLATQFPAQLRSQSQRMYNETMASCRTRVSFGVDAANARILAPDLGVQPQTLTRLEKFHAVVKRLNNPRPIIIRTEPLWPLRPSARQWTKWQTLQRNLLGANLVTPAQADACIQARQNALINPRASAVEPDSTEPDAFTRRVPK
jgi:hypothetical protein